MKDKKGLILTMGLSPEPLIFAINTTEADAIVFIGTQQSFDKSLDEIIEKTGILPSSYRTYSIADYSENIGTLVSKFHEGYLWIKEKSISQNDIIVDPTGGRKWMSSGATIAASFLGLRMIYIDVDYKNQKPDLETMRVVPLGNAYDQTGFIAAEQGRIAFNNSSFETAASYFSTIRPTSSYRADFYYGLAKLSHTLAKWDRFEHYDSTISTEIEDAHLLIERALKSGAGTPELAKFNQIIHNLNDGIKELEGKSEIRIGFIVDLFLNARRRFEVNRFDDCIARLYRTLEAVSQFFFKADFELDVSVPDYTLLSEESLQKFQNEFKLVLPEKLDLKRSFILLHLNNHHSAKDLIRIGKGNKIQFTLEGLLNERNESILAHGFRPIGKEKAQSFIGKIENLLADSFKNEYPQWLKALTVPALPELGL